MNFDKFLIFRYHHQFKISVMMTESYFFLVSLQLLMIIVKNKLNYIKYRLDSIHRKLDRLSKQQQKHINIKAIESWS